MLAMVHRVNRWRKLLCLAVTLLLLFGCSPDDSRLFGGQNGLLSRAHSDVDLDAPPAASRSAPEHEQKASIHAAYLAMRMKEAAREPEYAIAEQSDGVHAARSQGGRLQGAFDARGAQLKSEIDNWQARLDVTAIG